jgi:hypothetical protein
MQQAGICSVVLSELKHKSQANLQNHRKNDPSKDQPATNVWRVELPTNQTTENWSFTTNQPTKPVNQTTNQLTNQPTKQQTNQPARDLTQIEN